MTSDRKYQTLYYFTESYPYGISEQWKRNELEVFRKYFDRIVVIPRSFAGNPVARNIVEGVQYREPLITENGSRSTLNKILIQAAACFNAGVASELVSNATSPANVSRLLKYAYQIELIKRQSQFRDVLEVQDREPAVLYFYWGVGTADVIPFLPKSEDLIVCRFHGWDLYEERQPSGSFPFRDELLRKADLILPCSDNGARYIEDRHASVASKIHTARLGTLSKGRSPQADDGVLKLLSCSSITRVKRLDRLCKALDHVTIPVRWTHIGDGDLAKEIKELTTDLPSNVSVEFLGNFASEDVVPYMVSHPYDLFINVSKSEGVPVAIMEAFSAGIPVYATNVGGTSEIVDEKVGKLLPSHGDPQTIADELAGFFQLPPERKAVMRDAAFGRYEECANAHTNAERLAELIIETRKKARS